MLENSGNSTFIFFSIIIVIYIVGMSIYTLVEKYKKKKKFNS